MRCLRCFGNGTIVLSRAPAYEARCPLCGGTGGAPSTGARGPGRLLVPASRE